jgi:hypothetical protein
MARPKRDIAQQIVVPPSFEQSRSEEKRRIDYLVHLRETSQKPKSVFFDTRNHQLRYSESDTISALRKLRKKFYKAGSEFILSNDEQKLWDKWARAKKERGQQDSENLNAP